MTPTEREQRRLDRLRFIAEQMDIATKMRLPGGPVRLSPQEAIEFIARHIPALGLDGKYQRYAILKIFMTSHTWVEWTPEVYKALINAVLPVREPPLQSMMMCAESAFKLSSKDIVSAICTEAALDPKHRPFFDAMNAKDKATYYKMLHATPGLRRASARYLCSAIAKNFSTPTGPS